jgi:hypothetical protein
LAGAPGGSCQHIISRLPRQTLCEYQAANQALSDELSNVRNKSFQAYEIGSIFCHDACELIPMRESRFISTADI